MDHDMPDIVDMADAEPHDADDEIERILQRAIEDVRKVLRNQGAEER